MGNCENPCEREKFKKYPRVLFVHCLDKNNFKEFKKKLDKNLEVQDFIKASLIFESEGGKTNALGYAFIKNRPRFVKELILIPGLFEEMMERFRVKSFSLINFLCSRNFFECSKLLIKEPRFYCLDRSRSLTIEFECECQDLKAPDLPILVAARCGSLETINLFYNFFINRRTPPEEYSFDACDEKGENVELIACRAGNLELVKFLHEYCNRKFKTVNKLNENALAVCLASKNNPKKLFEVFKYLLEIVQVDFESCYEELLIMAKEEEIFNYLQGKLRGRGIDSKIDYFSASSSSSLAPSKVCKDEKIFTSTFLKSIRSQSFTSALSSIIDPKEAI